MDYTLLEGAGKIEYATSFATSDTLSKLAVSFEAIKREREREKEG